MTYFRHDLLLAPRLLTQGVTSLDLDARALVVKYEALVTNPETEVAAICRWLDLPFDQKMLEYGGQERVKGRYGDKVGTPKHRRPATTSLEKWLNLAKTPQTRHFAEAYLTALGTDLIRCLGYDARALEREIAGVPCGPGRVWVTWPELFPPEVSRANRLRLIYLDARLTGNLRRAIRDLWELIFGRL
jgi:hypothetical protein